VESEKTSGDEVHIENALPKKELPEEPPEHGKDFIKYDQGFSATEVLTKLTHWEHRLREAERIHHEAAGEKDEAMTAVVQLLQMAGPLVMNGEVWRLTQGGTLVRQKLGIVEHMKYRWEKVPSRAKDLDKDIKQIHLT